MTDVSELPGARRRRRINRVKSIVMTIAVLGMAGWTFPKMATEGYDYFVAAPCRAALEGAIAEFRAAKTDSTDLKVIAAFWAAHGQSFRDALAVPTCPDDVAAKRDALVVAMDKWVAFMAAVAADGNYSQSIYITVANDASTALRELEGTISAGERTQ